MSRAGFGELASGVSSSQMDSWAANEMGGIPTTDVNSFETWTNDASSTRMRTNAMPLVVDGCSVLEGGSLGTFPDVNAIIHIERLCHTRTLRDRGVTSPQKNGRTPRFSTWGADISHLRILPSGLVLPPSCSASYRTPLPSSRPRWLITCAMLSERDPFPKNAKSIHPSEREAQGLPSRLARSGDPGG